MKYRKVLLIDDDLDDQEIFTMALDQISPELECIIFKNSEEALLKLIQEQIKVDIIFLDLNLPRVSGQEILIKINKIEYFQNIPIIIFSTSSDKYTIKKLYELGASDFITKPNKLHLLVDTLKSIFI